MSKENVKVINDNKQGKDRLFKKLYESESNLKSLASFLIGEEPSNIKIASTIPILFGSKENDMSFICNDSLYIMMEEQSYNCGNMPYRMLEYIVTALRSTVKSEENLYGSKTVEFPVPKLYMLTVGIVSREKDMKAVRYKLKLSDYYKKSSIVTKNNIKPDLELTVNVYNFQMLEDETLKYIEKNVIPRRFNKYKTELFQYALVANSLTYVQRAQHENSKLKKPSNVKDTFELINLLKDRGIFVELFSKKEVCDMTIAQFSREDILYHSARSEGEKIGEARGVKIGEARGISIGEAQGENLMVELIQKLFANGRAEDVQKVSEDESYRIQLMKEFGLKN